jgi:hypothetical protein
MSETPQNSFQNFLQLITGLLLDFCASKMLYGHLEIRANSLSPKQCNKCCTTALGNMPKLPENSTTPSPRFLCLNNSRTDRTVYKIRTVQTVLFASVFVPFSCCTEFKNPYSTASLLGLYLASISVPALLVVRPALSVQYGLHSMLYLLPQFLC